MRHRVDGRKLGRTTSHRKAMFANLAASLVLNNRIETTLPKAKELRRVADRLVTLGKRQTVHSRRKAVALIRNRVAVRKIFDDLAKRFADRNGGYTRIYKLGYRHGDSAPMAAIEYLPEAHAEKAEVGKQKSKARVKAKKVGGGESLAKPEEEKQKKKAGAAKAEKPKAPKKKVAKKSIGASKKATKSK